MENVQSACAGDASGVEAEVYGVGLHGDWVASEGVGLGEVACCGAEHGEFLGWRRHFVFVFCNLCYFVEDFCVCFVVRR